MTPSAAENSASSLLSLLRTDLTAVLHDVRSGLESVSADYAAFLDHHQDEVAQAGELALTQFVQLVEQAQQGNGPLVFSDSVEFTLFEEIGRSQWQAGVSLATLLSAYHVGARVAWRHFAQSAARQGVSAEEIARLAESVFAFVDNLSDASAKGYVEAQADAVEERHRARDDLVTLLLTEGSDPAGIRVAARRAGWLLPQRIIIVLVDSNNPLSTDALSRLGSEALSFRQSGVVGSLISADRDGTSRERLHQVLRGAHGVVGPAVAPDRVPAALRLTVIAQRLRTEGVVSSEPVFVADHLDAVIVHQDARLLEFLQGEVLAPLSALSAETQRRLTDTLSSWLRQMGNQQAMAAELQVHRQTVRYRLAQLRELFGERLDDSAFRLKLTAALAWDSAAPRPVRQKRD